MSLEYLKSADFFLALTCDGSTDLIYEELENIYAITCEDGGIFDTPVLLMSILNFFNEYIHVHIKQNKSNIVYI